MRIKFCMDCKWSEQSRWGRNCWAPALVNHGPYYLANGEPKEPVLCEQARRDCDIPGWCGEEGRHWEPKESSDGRK